jgi:hypothetical protein
LGRTPAGSFSESGIISPGYVQMECWILEQKCWHTFSKLLGADIQVLTFLTEGRVMAKYNYSCKTNKHKKIYTASSGISIKHCYTVRIFLSSVNSLHASRDFDIFVAR